MKTLFYSWQSDLPTKTNRTLIEDACGRALRNLSDVTLDIRLDADTSGVPGTPDIVEAIFRKIGEADYFLADVSIINHDQDKHRKTPNPNVLLELGYAAAKLSWDNIITVINTHYGPVTDLPFDLSHRRPIQFSMAPTEEPAAAREQLARRIEAALQLVIESGLPRLRQRMIAFLDGVNPHIMTVARTGNRSFPVNLTAKHLRELEDMEHDENFAALLNYKSTGHSLSSKGADNGGINDQRDGPQTQFRFTFHDPLFTT